MKKSVRHKQRERDEIIVNNCHGKVKGEDFQRIIVVFVNVLQVCRGP